MPDDVERRIQQALANRPGVEFGRAEADQLVQAKTRRLETLIRQLQGSGPIWTSLPTAPKKGTRIIFQAAAMAAFATPIAWELFYDGSKWIPVHGPALFAETAAAETRTNVAYGDLSGGATGPAIALPLPGDYDIELGMMHNNSGVGGQGSMSYDIGGTAAVVADETANQTAVAGHTVTAQRVRRKTGLAAVTLTAKYKASAGTSTFRHRYMRVTPVRLG